MIRCHLGLMTVRLRSAKLPSALVLSDSRLDGSWDLVAGEQL